MTNGKGYEISFTSTTNRTNLNIFRKILGKLKENALLSAMSQHVNQKENSLYPLVRDEGDRATVIDTSQIEKNGEQSRLAGLMDEDHIF